MKTMKTAILLVNLGTPGKPERKEVAGFLTQFLNDPLVIDLPWFVRKLLVNLIIIPFRVRKSTKMYQRLWTDAGSPILLHLNLLRDSLQQEMPEDVAVYAAMRYGEPDLCRIIEEIESAQINKLYVFPLFPQFARSTTGSIIDLIQKHNFGLKTPLDIYIIDQYFNHPAFIEAFVQKIKTYHPETFDHVIFSYHSLPEKHLESLHPQYKCANCTCEVSMPEFGCGCYKAQCYATTRLITKSLDLSTDDYSVSFQSRFAKKWIGPFTDDKVVQLAQSGSERILVVAPSFVADCLETIVEIRMDYAELFKSHGGKELVLVDSLNSDRKWAQAISSILALTT